MLLIFPQADAKLSFAGDAASEIDHSLRYKKKAEISHLFREAESRPPAVISTLFSALVLLPALVMLFMVGTPLRFHTFIVFLFDFAEPTKS